MTWFADLSPCTYFGENSAPVLRAVGWLEKRKPFEIEARDKRVYEKLQTLSNNPWQPNVTMGCHECELCAYEPALGSENIFIPADGFLFVCPVLITHYMNAHSYGPPESFCDAVLRCPPMRSMEYLKSVLANGGRLLEKDDTRTEML
jgi:hypothetical protein